MDSFTVSRLGRELFNLYKGAPLEKAWQPSDKVFYISFRRHKRGLFIRLDSNEPLVWTDVKPEMPPRPSGMAMLIRKHLESGKLKGIEVPKGERVMILDFDPGQLVLELLPRTPNLVVVWDGYLMGSARPVERPKGTFLTHGSEYKMPIAPQGSRDDGSGLDEAWFTEHAEEAATQGWELLFRKACPALPRALAEEADFRIQKMDSKNPFEIFTELLGEARSLESPVHLHAASPWPESGFVKITRPKDIRLSTAQLTHLDGFHDRECPNLLDALLNYHETLRLNHLLDSPLSREVKKCRNRLKSLKRTLNKVEAELEKAHNHESPRRMGDLILINLKTPVTDRTTLIVQDIIEDPPVEARIPIDPKKNLKDNADKYFNRARRLKRAIDKIGTRIRIIKKEITDAEARLSGLLEGKLKPDVEETATPKAPTLDGRSKTPKAWRGLYRYESSDGYVILAGKSAPTNDKLTTKVAHPHDMWLHASGFGGSHVVVFNPEKKQELPDTTLQEAAQIAAWHSKGRPSGAIDVSWTWKRHVKKRKGAATGMVYLRKFQTIRVKPEEVLKDLSKEG